MKYPHLHRNLFAIPPALMGWEWRGQCPILFLLEIERKCPDLHRKTMFIILLPWGEDGEKEISKNIILLGIEWHIQN